VAGAVRTFEVLRFEAVVPSAAVALLELAGRFPAGARPQRPHLVVEGADGRERQAPALATRVADGVWSASFAVDAAALDGDAAFALGAARGLLVALPAPTPVEPGGDAATARYARLAREANDLRRRLDAASRAAAEAAALRAELERTESELVRVRADAARTREDADAAREQLTEADAQLADAAAQLERLAEAEAAAERERAEAAALRERLAAAEADAAGQRQEAERWRERLAADQAEASRRRDAAEQAAGVLREQLALARAEAAAARAEAERAAVPHPGTPVELPDADPPVEVEPGEAERFERDADPTQPIHAAPDPTEPLEPAESDAITARRLHRVETAEAGGERVRVIAPRRARRAAAEGDEAGAPVLEPAAVGARSLQPSSSPPARALGRGGARLAAVVGLLVLIAALVAILLGAGPL
jgi:hypothetical protein